MIDMLFIGGPRHMHRMPIPVEVDPNEITKIRFGEELYEAAGDYGYKYHPDEREHNTWILWHTDLQVVSIERLIDVALAVNTKRLDKLQRLAIESLKVESTVIQEAQAPHVYSGICMIRFASQRHQHIRFQWSWLGFAPRMAELPGQEVKMVGP